MAEINLNFIRPFVEDGVTPRLMLRFEATLLDDKNFRTLLLSGDCYLMDRKHNKVWLSKIYGDTQSTRIQPSKGSRNDLRAYLEMNDSIVRAIEESRAGGDVLLNLDIHLLGHLGENPDDWHRVTVLDKDDDKVIRIPQRDWLGILEQIRYQTTRLFEVKTDFPKPTNEEMIKVVDNLQKAQSELGSHETRNSIASCRVALEGIDKTIKAWLEQSNFEFSSEELEQIGRGPNDGKESIKNRIRLEHIIGDKVKAVRIHDVKSKLRHMCSSLGSHEGTKQEIYFHEANSVLQMTLAIVSLISKYLK